MKYIPLLLLISLSFRAHSLPTHQSENCDTINIDECFFARNGERFVIDTIVEEEIEGLFSILSVKPLFFNYCMIFVEHTDTSYTVYDSIIIKDSVLYLIDTFYSSTLYNILVENKEELKGPLQNVVDLYLSEDDDYDDEDDDYDDEDDEETRDITVHLRLKRLYNIVRKSKMVKKVENESNVGITANCDLCQILIIHGKKETIHDCPLYNNLYRLT